MSALSTLRKPAVYRVRINPKFWRAQDFMRDKADAVKAGAEVIIIQSKGRAKNMANERNHPRLGDLVKYILAGDGGKVVMLGVVQQDGFTMGEDHLDDPYNIPIDAPHRTSPFFTKVRIIAIYASPTEVVPRDANRLPPTWFPLPKRLVRAPVCEDPTA